MRGGRAGPRGFTLIEVAVVLVVLALAAGLVIPSVTRGLDAVRGRSDVAAVTAFLRYAREQAITRRQVLEVRLDAETQTLVLTAGERGAIRASRSIRPPTLIAIQAARGVTFSPEGRSSGGAFLLETPGRRVYRVSVDPLSGRVSNRRVS